MFKRIGKKIKVLAMVICWLNIALWTIGSVIGGYYIIKLGDTVSRYSGSGNYTIYGILVMIIGIGIGFLISWIGSFMLFGYGEIVDKLDQIEMNTRSDQGYYN